MLVKCGMVVLAIGATACGLLTIRQSRLQAASELAQAQLRISTSDEKLWALRSQIAERVTPGNVERMAASVGPLKPIAAPPMLTPDQVIPGLAEVEGVPGAPRRVRIVSNTASSQRDLPRPTDTISPAAKTVEEPVELAPGAKPAAKAGAKPLAKPRPKRAAPPKASPDTLLRANAAAKQGATQVAGAKSPASPSGKPARRAATISAAKKHKSTEPRATLIAMQPERP